jgi:hypothetical protein
VHQNATLSESHKALISIGVRLENTLPITRFTAYFIAD